MYLKGKDIRKKRHLAAFVYVSSIVLEKILAETPCWEIERK
jgi:hypothetical protein